MDNQIPSNTAGIIDQLSVSLFGHDVPDACFVIGRQRYLDLSLLTLFVGPHPETGQWKSRMAGRFPVDFHFLDEAFEGLYLSEAKMSRVFAYFTAVGIIIACLGLFGLVSFSAERRTKEIGIRKVLGASVPSLVRVISREFLVLVMIAILIALPLARIVMSRWLQNFSYRIDITWFSFLVSGLFVVAISLATAAFRSLRAARVDPVHSIRYE